MLDALQHSWLAQTIAQSQMLTASLSAAHLLGFTLVMGSAVVSNLRLLGVMFTDQPATHVTQPARRALLLGACLSAATGVLLFMPRATGAVANDFFRVKMTLLLLALLLVTTVQGKVARREAAERGVARLVGAVGLALWVGVALAASAFILLE
ncbi:MAG: DUF6644 family protein [Vicinamibacterales bacterium]